MLGKKHKRNVWCMFGKINVRDHFNLFAVRTSTLNQRFYAGKIDYFAWHSHQLLFTV